MRVSGVAAPPLTCSPAVALCAPLQLSLLLPLRFLCSLCSTCDADQLMPPRTLPGGLSPLPHPLPLSPPRLRQMCPTLAYVKEDCCMSTLGSTQLKLSAGPVARTPPFPTPPACPPASTSATSTASTTCLPHLPPTLLPTPRPARLLSYSLPAYTTRRGGPVPGGLLLPRPALLLKSQQRTSRP